MKGDFKELRTLYLGGCGRFADAEFLGQALEKGLSFLSLVDCHSLSTRALKMAFRHSSQLTTLVLGGCRVDDELCGLIGAGCPQLTSLDLWNCPHVTRLGVSRIIRSRAPLYALNLRECLKVSGDVLLDFGHKAPTLRTLDISFLGPVKDDDLLPLLARHPLRCFHCGGPRCYVTERIFEALPKALEALDLADSALLTLEGLHLPGLVALSLEGSTCPATELLELCQRHPQLTSLNLSRCAVTDAMAVELAKMPKLAELELSGTLVGDEGLRTLQGRLLHLGLRSCAISRTAVEEAQRAMPACVIDWDEA